MAETSQVGMLAITVTLFPEGSVWIAHCAELDLMTQGSSRNEAGGNFNEALALFIDSCLRRGVLDQVLKEYGHG